MTRKSTIFTILISVTVTAVAPVEVVRAESSIATDRTAILIRLDSDSLVPPARGHNTMPRMTTLTADGKSNDLEGVKQKILDNPWRVLALSLSFEASQDNEAAFGCGGTLSNPVLNNRPAEASTAPTVIEYLQSNAPESIGGMPFMFQPRQVWRTSPCYWIPTIQYVEDRVEEAFADYFDETQPFGSEGDKEIVAGVVANETQALEDRVTALEALVVSLQAELKSQAEARNE